MCFIALDHGGIRKVGVLIGWKNSARTQASLRDNELFFLEEYDGRKDSKERQCISMSSMSFPNVRKKLETS